MKNFLLLLTLTLVGAHYVNATPPTAPKNPVYTLSVTNFINSMVAVQTGVPEQLAASTNLTTTSSAYFYGRAPLYNTNNQSVGVCSASFMCSQDTNNSIYTDISNYISTRDGLIVTWFTPTNLANLELDSIVNGMVTQCQVTCTTLVGRTSPYYGKKYTLVVSSDGSTITFAFKQMN